MVQKQMRCQMKAESLFFPTMYKSQKVTLVLWEWVTNVLFDTYVTFMFLVIVNKVKLLLQQFWSRKSQFCLFCSTSCTHCPFSYTQYTGHPPLTSDLNCAPVLDVALFSSLYIHLSCNIFGTFTET